MTRHHNITKLSKKVLVRNYIGNAILFRCIYFKMIPLQRLPYECVLSTISKIQCNDEAILFENNSLRKGIFSHGISVS